MLLALLWSISALAGDAPTSAPTDSTPTLVSMARQYGWGTVASVIQANTTGDVSVSDAHERLEGLGLDRLEVPIRVDPVLGELGPLGPLTGCGWNDGVTCGMALPAGTRLPLGWVPRCASRSGPVDTHAVGSPLVAVVEPRPTADEPGKVYIGDVHTCWLAGGDRILLAPVGAAPPPRPVLLGSEGVEEAQGQAVLDIHSAALAACMHGRGVITLDFDDGALSGVRVLRDGLVQEAETACVRTVVDKVTVRAAGRARISLVVPAI
jgi:hypothetical protein